MCTQPGPRSPNLLLRYKQKLGDHKFQGYASPAPHTYPDVPAAAEAAASVHGLYLLG